MTSGLNAIPDWNYDGVLSAREGDDPVAGIRSPYAVSLVDLVERFGSTQRRRRLLRGLLDFRAELHKAGLVQGFQWVNGSFMENVEQNDGRPPNDIDLVTFFYIPEGHTSDTISQALGSLLNPAETKENFSVDAYFSQLNQIDLEIIIKRSTYWYSLWSHTRTEKWKGYLQIDLAADDHDGLAWALLDQMDNDGGGQE